MKLNPFFEHHFNCFENVKQRKAIKTIACGCTWIEFTIESACGWNLWQKKKFKRIYLWKETQFELLAKFSTMFENLLHTVKVNHFVVNAFKAISNKRPVALQFYTQY